MTQLYMNDKMGTVGGGEMKTKKKEDCDCWILEGYGIDGLCSFCVKQKNKEKNEEIKSCEAALEEQGGYNREANEIIKQKDVEIKRLKEELGLKCYSISEFKQEIKELRDDLNSCNNDLEDYMKENQKLKDGLKSAEEEHHRLLDLLNAKDEALDKLKKEIKKRIKKLEDNFQDMSAYELNFLKKLIKEARK